MYSFRSFAVTRRLTFMLYDHLTCNIHSPLSGWETLMFCFTCYKLELFPLTWRNRHITDYMSCVCSLLHFVTWCESPIHQPDHLGIKNGVDQTCCFHLRCCHHYCLEAGNLHMNERRSSWTSWKYKEKESWSKTKSWVNYIIFKYPFNILKLYWHYTSNSFKATFWMVAASLVECWGFNSPLNFTWADTDVLAGFFVQRLVRNFTREGLPCFPLCLRDMKLTGYCHTSICTHAEVISWWRSLLRLRKPFNLRVEAPSRAQESLCSWLFTGVQKELHWWVH